MAHEQIWCSSRETAIERVSDGLRRETPLDLIDIPILQPGDWQALDVQTRSGGQAISDAERLCWLAGLWYYNQSDGQYEASGGRRINEALNCGTRSNAFVALVELGRRMRLDDTAHCLDSDHSRWLDRRFKMARLYKRMGRFSSAIELNMRLSRAIPGNLSEVERWVAESRVLLNLSKAASSQGMRIGRGLVLARLATKRMRQVAARLAGESNDSNHEDISRLLGRAIGLEMGTEFDMVSALTPDLQQVDSDMLDDLFSRWDEAKEVLDDAAIDDPRLSFHQCWARFQCAGPIELRERERDKFLRLLMKIDRPNNDARGRAIRSGQYADMLLEMNLSDVAFSMLTAAVADAARVCDWQVLSINLARMAKWHRRQLSHSADAGELALKFIKEAKHVLGKMEEPPPSLHVSHCQAEADLCCLLGRWNDALVAMEEANGHLDGMRKQLSDESASVALSGLNVNVGGADPGYSFVPITLLSPDEVALVNSVAIDWKIITSKQSALLRQWAAVKKSVGRVELQTLSSQRLTRYGSTLVHRIKTHYSLELKLLNKNITQELAPLVAMAQHQGLALPNIVALVNEAGGRAESSLAEALQIRVGTENETFHSALQLGALSDSLWKNLLQSTGARIEHDVYLDDGDFYLKGFADEIRDYLYNCFENAARLLAQDAHLAGPKRIDCRVSWHPGEVGVGQSKGYGCIEICDTAGRTEELRSAVAAILLNEPEKHWHGLAMAISFLREQYECRVSVRGIEGASSVLRFEFDDGVRVAPV